MAKYIDALLVFAIVVAGTWLGLAHVRALRHGGATPLPTGFNQRVYAAAVMSACGRGLTTPSLLLAAADQPRPRDRAFAEFVTMRRDALACAEIAADVQGDGLDGLQRASRYLLLAFAGPWKISGPSWTTIDWLLGVLYALSVTAAFALCRMTMNRWVAAGVAVLLLTSPLHLEQLADLRDYSKAPFFLVTLTLIAFVVAASRTPAMVIGAVAAGGAAIALGFGMRTDNIINLVVLLAAVTFFLPGAWRATAGTRAAAVLAGVVTFGIVSSPLLANTETNSSPWHVILLGFGAQFDDALEIEGGPYQLGNFYSDSYVATQVDAYWARISTVKERVSVGLPHYAEASRGYFFELIRTFPGDMALRAWAAVLQVIALPFSAGQLLEKLHPLTLWIFALAILGLSACNLRLAILLTALIVVLGAYPSLQFQRRHVFHLEIVGLWALGFVLSWIVPVMQRRVSLHGRYLQPVLFAAALIIFIVLPVSALRASQQVTAADLFRAYSTAAQTAYENGPVAIRADRRSMYSGMIVAELSSASCHTLRPQVTFRYSAARAELDFTQTLAVDLPAGHTAQVFFPVFESGPLSPEPDSLRFGEIELPDADRPCLVRVGRLAGVDELRLLIPAVLRDDWTTRPLRQSLRGWEAIHN